MSFDRMIDLIRSKSVEGLGEFSLNTADIAAARKQVLECPACVLGKQTRTQFDHRGLDRGQRPGEIIHMDTYVLKFDNKDGQPQVQYGISMMDVFSREGWHSRVYSKDQVAAAVIKQLKEIERHCSNPIKRLYSDGGSEFVNQTLKAYLEKEGIQIRVSPPHTQQLNGAAERSIRTFKDAARTLLQHAHAPNWLWHQAVSHAVWVWNRTRVSSANKKTPYETACGRVPSLKERTVGVWGCDCFVHQRKELRAGAMAAKSEPGIYLGHSEEANAPLVLILRTGKAVVSRDVRFFNDRFSHMRAYRMGPEQIEALLDGISGSPGGQEDSGEYPDDDQIGMPAQGGLVQPSAVAQKEEKENNFLSNTNSQPNEDEYLVDRILDVRYSRDGIPTYKVRWAGCGPEQDSWEPKGHVEDCEALQKFEDSQPAAAVKEPIRRSERLAKSGQQPEQSSTEFEDAGSGALVEMAMMGLRSLTTADEWPEEQQLRQAMIAAAAATSESISDRTPKTLEEAMKMPDWPKWEEARRKELDSCLSLRVWEEVDRASLAKGTTILPPPKDVFKLKVDEDGKVIQYKARFTPKGFLQKEGIDYKETFARTGMYKTERIALSLCSRYDLELVQFDVPTAFLNADVEEDVYMEYPKGFGKNGQVVKLLKSLYGLKQAPRNWDKLVHGFITNEMGWTATVSDPSFYYKRSKTGRLMLLYRFVDDMQGQFHRADQAEFEQSSGQLRERFNIKQMTTATWMLGMKIVRNRKERTITLDQSLYLETALKRFGLDQCKSVSTPELPGAMNDTKDPRMDLPADRQRYMEITGTLMYAAISSRLDIAHAVHYLACNMVAPTARHMLAAERVLRYLAGTKDIGLVFGSRNGDAISDSRGRGTGVEVEVCAFADADWAGDHRDRKSVSGWVAKINGDPISWSSKKQRVVALSTCEAELYAEAAAIQEVLWIRGMLAELGLNSSLGSTVYGDNQSTIAVSKNGVKGERTKHVDVKYHFVTQTVEEGKVKLKWIPTQQQQADLFTKALPVATFLKLRAELMTR
jgi:hypothetical protein